MMLSVDIMLNSVTDITLNDLSDTSFNNLSRHICVTFVWETFLSSKTNFPMSVYTILCKTNFFEMEKNTCCGQSGKTN